jgi:hypothetical protein
MTSPLLDDHLRLGSAAEPFEAQALVAELQLKLSATPFCHHLDVRPQRSIDCW